MGAQEQRELSDTEFLIERVVRVEEELRHQRELITTILHQMDKRFEEMQRNMDKRFEQMDKRFNFMQWTMMFGLTLLGVMITVYRFIP
ncbi:MAG: hypothetical protein AAF975_00455 [Spirochaetota bacterium]